MAYVDDAHAPTHEEHTGHGAHHVLSVGTLLRTFGALVALTVLTAALAFAERSGVLPLGGLSVPVALLIAGAKAALVAGFFMGLKYDKGTNLLAFVGSIVFLCVFLSFSYLDTGFRDTFEEQMAVPVDIIRAREAALQAQEEQIQREVVPPPVTSVPDTALFPNAPRTPPPTPTPQP